MERISKIKRAHQRAAHLTVGTQTSARWTVGTQTSASWTVGKVYRQASVAGDPVSKGI